MSVRATGHLTLQLVHEDGSEEVFETDNLVVNNGKASIANRMLQTPAYGPQEYLAVGNNGTAPAVSDGGLVAEVARIHGSSFSVSGQVFTITGTFGPGVGTGPLYEAGVFDTPNPAATTMLSRAAFAVVNKAAGDTLNLSWTVTIG
jgi:hypothetical protein